MEQRKKEGEVSRLEYLSWFTKHEPNCYLNHEGRKFALDLLDCTREQLGEVVVDN